MYTKIIKSNRNIICKKEGICLACKEYCELTDEHIIPQVIGGRLKDKLYCKKCNNSFGRSLDNEISKNFGQWATILNVKRQRGSNQNFDVEELKTKTKLVVNGREIRRKNPIIKKEVESNGKTLRFYDVCARSKKELEQIICSLEKKYKTPGESQIFKEYHHGPMDTKLEASFNNKLILRAITKIAYGFACHKLPQEIILSDCFDEVRSYITVGNGADLASANFIHTRFMNDYIRPLHKICISLNRQDKIVIGYVMLFGIYRYSILISRKYESRLEWPGLDYTFDPSISKQVPVRSNFRAPYIKVNNILHPKQSKEFVRKEIRYGFKVFEKYTTDFEFLGIDL